MMIKVDGVPITLTKAQVNQIEKVKAERLKELTSFEKTLLYFGFKRYKDTRDASDRCYTNDEKGWWAEIYDSNRVWITGEGLKTSSFPGGWIYWDPKEIIEELIKYD